MIWPCFLVPSHVKWSIIVHGNFTTSSNPLYLNTFHTVKNHHRLLQSYEVSKDNQTPILHIMDSLYYYLTILSFWVIFLALQFTCDIPWIILGFFFYEYSCITLKISISKIKLPHFIVIPIPSYAHSDRIFKVFSNGKEQL